MLSSHHKSTSPLSKYYPLHSLFLGISGELLSTEGLTYSYGSESPKLRFPDIQIEDGGSLLILGESGVGKTTLLHLLAGILRPTTGSIRYGDEVLTGKGQRALDVFRAQHIGMVFQSPTFVRSLSLMENLLLVQHLAGNPKDRARCEQVLEALDLADKSGRLTQRLSEGERQRAGIALAVVNGPTCILADEPTSSLDDTRTEQVLDLLQREAKANRSMLLIITHDKRVKDIIPERIEL